MESTGVKGNMGMTWINLCMGPFIQYVLRKIFRKTNISYPLIRTRARAYKGVRIVRYKENFAHVN